MGWNVGLDCHWRPWETGDRTGRVAGITEPCGVRAEIVLSQPSESGGFQPGLGMNVPMYAKARCARVPLRLGVLLLLFCSSPGSHSRFRHVRCSVNRNST
jgi:hypothetical protein